MTYFLIYLLLGAVSGLMAGLLGVGGGLIIVPALLFLFGLQNFSGDIAMHMAIGTSLAAVTVTVIASTFAHHKKGTVEWVLWRKLSPGLIVGSLLGAAVADLLPGNILRVIFGCFEILVAIYIVRDMQPPGWRFPKVFVTGMLAVLIGIVCVLLGIGGGLMVVLFLLWAGVPIKNAVSTSAAASLPVAFTGAVGFIFLGIDAESLPQGSSGYIYWPAFLGIAIASVVIAPYGAKLSHALSPVVLRQIFAVFLFVLGVVMLAGF